MFDISSFNKSIVSPIIVRTISVVILNSTPFKVLNSVVCLYLIYMIYLVFITIYSWYPRHRYQPVYCLTLHHSIFMKIQLIVSPTVQLWFQYLSSLFVPYITKVTDLIQSLITYYIFPLFHNTNCS